MLMFLEDFIREHIRHMKYDIFVYLLYDNLITLLINKKIPVVYRCNVFETSIGNVKTTGKYEPKKPDISLQIWF